MRKAAAALLCLLCRTMPLASSELVFEQTYDLPRPLGGRESVTVGLTTGNEMAVVQPDPLIPTRIRVCTTTKTSLTITKHEESGGYAHGIDWWIDGVEQDRLLYAYAGNGSRALGTFASGTVIEIQLYFVDVFFHKSIEPRYRIATLLDSTGPSIVLSPAPGSYPGVTVTATVSDAGVGLPEGLLPVCTVTDAETGEKIEARRTNSVRLDEEGRFHILFTSMDLLWNTASNPSGSGSPNEYLVDHTAPAVSGVSPSLAPRQDGALDYAMAFTLGDAGAGVALDSLRVTLTCRVAEGALWMQVLDGTQVEAAPVPGGFHVQVPPTKTPRSTTLTVDIAASDAVGNAIPRGSASFVYPMPPAALHATVRCANVTAAAVRAGSRLVARYKVPLVLDRPRDALRADGVARYRLLRTPASSGDAESVLDLSPAEFADRFVDHEGRAVFIDVMEGARYAHDSVTYRLETEFATAGVESTAVEGLALMPNIEAWQVHLADGGSILPSIDSACPVLPELHVTSLAGLLATIDLDPEGDPLAMRLEAVGPGGIASAWPATGLSTAIAFAEVFPDAPDGTYQVRFVIEEAGNPRSMASPWCAIVVDPNAGWIDGDVTWTTDQVRPGSVIVNPGARLTVGDNVRISFARAIDPVTGSALGMFVRPGGTLVLSPGSIVQPVGWQPGTQPGDDWGCWAGIEAEGTVTVDGAAIVGALRGIACLPGSVVTLVGARLEACRTGIHAIGAGVDPYLGATWFVACTRYGIKEDTGAAPVVVQCVFDHNTYDYYDTGLTTVTAGEIDGLEPGLNHGNRSAGGTP